MVAELLTEQSKRSNNNTAAMCAEVQMGGVQSLVSSAMSVYMCLMSGHALARFL